MTIQPSIFKRKRNVQSLLPELSSEEKIALLSGDDMWHTVEIERLGIPRVRCSDGPNGVRGTAWTNGAPASCFPCGTGIGASFDIKLVERIGRALGQECVSRGVHCLLGPTTNIQRHPCGGRGFETYSEDPLLAGTVAAAWIRGVQSQKVMTTPKREAGKEVADPDFVANEQETMRRSSNSVIDERTLHEIYLEPFRLQMSANPVVFMTSYNRVNGLHVAEHTDLLQGILRDTWGFDGMIMSDWSGTYSSSEAIKAGLDLEMPGPSIMRGASVERDIVSRKLEMSDVDKCVTRILGYVQHAIESGIPFEAEEKANETATTRELLLEAAEAAVVLLKNSASILPLAKSQRVAVIGPNADARVISGGGSANLSPTYAVSPRSAIQAKVDVAGGSITYTKGVDSERWLPLLTPYLSCEMGQGVMCHFYSEDPWTADTAPLFSKFNNSGFSYFIDGIPSRVPVRGYVSLRTTFTPDETGVWELGLGVSGQADLYMDGDRIIDNSNDQTPSVLFFNMGAEERTSEVHLEAGQIYDLEVRFSNFKQLHSTSPYLIAIMLMLSGRRGGIRLGGRKKRVAEDEIIASVELARRADVAILVIGTNNEWESEGYDRDTLSLPGRTDDLVRAVLEAQPNTVIVNQSGMPVEMPWITEASTVVQSFFGGNETGNAIANVLFGDANPSGKLPITWPKSRNDIPADPTFGDLNDVTYSEGLRVGYRCFDRLGGPESAFPFGFGLSYTTFALSDLDVESRGFGAVVQVTIQNTGRVAGAETVQTYVHQRYPSVWRPEVELGAFSKVYLEPGETRTIEMILDHTAFSFYNAERKHWVCEEGAFEIRVGSASTELPMVRTWTQPFSYQWTGVDEPKRGCEGVKRLHSASD